MLKNVNWKGVFKLFCWVVCLTGLVFLMGFVEKKKQSVVCKDVRIIIPGSDNFIESDEINAILSDNFGELRGLDFHDINIHKIEQKIAENPYIDFVKVYAEMDGVINIKVTQREPVLRVLNVSGQDYYLDSKGLKMPMSSNFTAHVLVANGFIKENFSGKLEPIESKQLNDLYKTAVFIKNDSLWNAQIEQLYVNDNYDMEFIPRVGIQKILLGDADDLEIKMKNLLIFYKKAMPKVGWDTYKTINIKYTNQIIAEKNKIDSTKRNQVIVLPQVNPDSTQNVTVDAENAASLKNNAEGVKNPVIKKENNATGKKQVAEKNKTQQ